MGLTMNFQATNTALAGGTALVVLPEALNALPITAVVVLSSGATARLYASCADHSLLMSDPDSVSFVEVDEAILTESMTFSITTPVSALKVEAIGSNVTLEVRTFDTSVDIK